MFSVMTKRGRRRWTASSTLPPHKRKNVSNFYPFGRGLMRLLVLFGSRPCCKVLEGAQKAIVQSLGEATDEEI